MHLLRYVVKRTVTDSPLNAQASCMKCPPSAWINFLCDQRTCKLTKHCSVVAALRIHWRSSLVFTSCAYTIAFM